MRYLGTGFSITIGGMRLRLQIDLDDAPDHEPDGHDARGEPHTAAGSFEHDFGGERPPHHLRPRRA